jgi:hypothetical protein
MVGQARRKDVSAVEWQFGEVEEDDDDDEDGFL